LYEKKRREEKKAAAFSSFSVLSYCETEKRARELISSFCRLSSPRAASICCPKKSSKEIS
jgi:hypothetical protein